MITVLMVVLVVQVAAIVIQLQQMAHPESLDKVTRVGHQVV
jgi:hypothetical protein